MTERTEALTVTRGYHERTKHHRGRFARSLGRMDWESQPDPFRQYVGAPRLPLDEEAPSGGPGLDAAWDPGATQAATPDTHMVARLFYDALALSAWKEAGGARWPLRVNPSSGNLHPTEAYLVAGPIAGLTEVPGVYHYCPEDHSLEHLRSLSTEEHRALVAPLSPETLLVALTSIPWRESWKYGERAFRYCQLDVGHALACLAASAALFGWRTVLLPGVTEADLGSLLGTAAQAGPEAELSEALLALVPRDHPLPRSTVQSYALPKAIMATLAKRPHGFEPARLSQKHHLWPVIDEVARATAKMAHTELPEPPSPTELARREGDDSTSLACSATAGATLLPSRSPDPPARQLIRGRRSAVDMDVESSMTAAQLYRLLAVLTPGGDRLPHAALPWPGKIHPLLFVHRVEGLTPGLYLLLREPGAKEPLFSALRPGFMLEPPPGAPPDLPLYLLAEGDVQALGRDLLCGQDIASDGVFAVAMLADLHGALQDGGPWTYRTLHWEAGALGQVLYLEAEAMGMRGTGIGCFFDDPIRVLLGLEKSPWHCLYGFTVGGAVEDPRLRMLPAYGHG